MNNSINKPTVFKRDNAEDMKLYEWLQRNLIKGEFTDETKAYWRKRMNESKMGSEGK
jgi:hypothetical protein